jgi:hypothetical protein
MRLQCFVEGFLVFLGGFHLVMACFLEWGVSVQPPRFGTATTTEGHLSAINLRMGDLEQIISAGNMKVFAGLCLVAAAVLYAARRRAADKPPQTVAAPGSQAPTSP